MQVTGHYLSDMIALQPCVSCLRFVHGHCFGLSAGTYTLTQLRYDLRYFFAIFRHSSAHL
jgi:esterase/lipase superfamily enzyme